MIFFLSILGTLIPTLCYIGIIYWADRYEKEPISLLTAAFFWGAIPSIIAAFIINTGLSLGAYAIAGDELGDLISAAIIAPVVEEILKGIALLLLLWWWRNEIDSWLDGIVYGAMIGLGFAMVENVYYFMNVYEAGGLQEWEINILMRSIIFGLNHSLFTSFTGLGIAISKLSPNSFTRFAAPLIGLGFSIFSHALHNFSATMGEIFCLLLPINAWGGVLLMVFIIIWALAQERKWMVDYLKEEVVDGLLSVEEYHLICSKRERVKMRVALFTAFKWGPYRQTTQFFLRCSELAYKKHHYELFASEKNRLEVERVRGLVLALHPWLKEE